MNMTRRAFLVGSLSVGIVPLRAMEPISRVGTPKLKLSLAAYSFRQHLPNYRGGQAPGNADMDMLGFVEYAAGLDLDGVELTSYFLPQPCPDELALQLKRRCHVLGLDISGGAIGNNYAYPPGDELDRQMAYTEQWLKTYALMGAPVIRVFAGQPQSADMDEQQAVAHIKRNLNQAGRMAAPYGVILAIENHDFTTRIDRYLDVLAAVDSPWIAANLDSGNIASTPDPYKELERIAPYAVNVQIKVKIPRNGVKEDADLARLVAIMRDAGYSGYIVLEYEEPEDPYQMVPHYLAELRNAMA